MEVTIKLSEENLDAIAEKVVAIQNKNKLPDKPLEEIQYTVNEVAKMSKREAQTVRKHINIGLLIAEKSGKSWLISQNNYNKYIKNEQ